MKTILIVLAAIVLSFAAGRLSTRPERLEQQTVIEDAYHLVRVTQGMYYRAITGDR